jgi:hypothetical protein
MPLPLIPIAVAAVAAYFLSKGKDNSANEAIYADVLKKTDPETASAFMHATASTEKPFLAGVMQFINTKRNSAPAEKKPFYEQLYGIVQARMLSLP